MKITKNQFNAYERVRKGGRYNMFDPNARIMTSLSRDQWLDIMKNYSELKEKYEGGDNESK